MIFRKFVSRLLLMNLSPVVCLICALDISESSSFYFPTYEAFDKAYIPPKSLGSHPDFYLKKKDTAALVLIRIITGVGE